jgi:hypothetical protein
MLCPTPTSAARWTTRSTPFSARASAASSRIVGGHELHIGREALGPGAVAVDLLDKAVENPDLDIPLKQG